MNEQTGTLIIIATPIGNLEDVSIRCLRIIKEADVLACEDTRHTQRILLRYNITEHGKLFPYHEHNENRATHKLLQILQEGKSIALVSNAGFPGISDPGFRIVRAARDARIHVDVIPGPSAVTTALLSSGLPTSSFTFKGFPPKKRGQRQKFIELEKDVSHTLIFFESPYRIGSFLEDAYQVLGNRLGAVCIELTKKFERVHRDNLRTLADMFMNKKVKGEITVVIAGNNPKFLEDSPRVSHDNDEE
ncbi:MAG: 16S rRNA (cytidine(1402)-2'-O)-methyltransferase [Spirochaetales bacterium]|nr:16S rRNA (cytidine(1402)-2'-O)-methyltransferase [Spirochaetales bacterium]